jgi:glycerophosphoryl diester phosphodiesterase
MRRHILFLAILAIVACSPTRKYKSLPEVRSWEKDIRGFEQLDKNVSYPDDAVLFAGSSSIRLWNTLDADMAPYKIIQRGYGGSKLSDFAVYADRIFRPHKCSAIVLFVANDITGDPGDKKPEEVAKLFRSILKTIRSTHSKTPVFWIEITPTPLRWKVWPGIQKANNLIRLICESNDNTYFINTAKAFLDAEGKPDLSFFREDKLHLTPKGYEVWKQIIKKELNKIIPMPKPEFIGHRGASYLAPENTVASAKLAWELGADAVETDIYLSKDNKIIVSHDANTKRITGKKYIISETIADTLRSLDAGSFKDQKYRGEKIPYLDEIIETVPPGKKLVIEIKCGSEVLPFLKQSVERHGSERHFSFISFDFNTIADTKKAFPGKSCYWLCSDTSLFNKNIEHVREAGLEGVSLSYNIINKRRVDVISKLGLELYCWTVDNPEEAKRLIMLGVRGITTNRTGWMQEQLKDFLGTP